MCRVYNLIADIRGKPSSHRLFANTQSLDLCNLALSYPHCAQDLCLADILSTLGGWAQPIVGALNYLIVNFIIFLCTLSHYGKYNNSWTSLYGCRWTFVSWWIALALWVNGLRLWRTMSSSSGTGWWWNTKAVTFALPLFATLTMTNLTPLETLGLTSPSEDYITQEHTCASSIVWCSPATSQHFTVLHGTYSLLLTVLHCISPNL